VQIPDKGFLSSANSGMMKSLLFFSPVVGVACLNVGGQVTNQIRLNIDSVQIPDKGFLSSANSGMTESVLFFSPVLVLPA
jgi:uncharacterized membrane protein